MTDKVAHPNDSRAFDVGWSVLRFLRFLSILVESMQLAQCEMRGVDCIVLLNRWVDMMFVEPWIWSWPPLSQIELISFFWLIKLDPILRYRKTLRGFLGPFDDYDPPSLDWRRLLSKEILSQKTSQEWISGFLYRSQKSNRIVFSQLKKIEKPRERWMIFKRVFYCYNWCCFFHQWSNWVRKVGLGLCDRKYQTICLDLLDLWIVPGLSSEFFKLFIVWTISAAILEFSASKSYRFVVPPPRVRTNLNTEEDLDDCWQSTMVLIW